MSSRRQRTLRRERLREFSKMAKLADTEGSWEFTRMRDTLNGMPRWRRFWNGVKLIAGRL